MTVEARVLSTFLDVAKQIAREGAEAERIALATRADTPPELLYYLAADPAAAVRAAVAGNAATPGQADRLLAGDPETQVRITLARRVAALAPGVSPAAQDKLGRLAWETLRSLAEDTVEAVRGAIADVVAEMPDAPRELILALARDIEMSVAEPVIRLSPILTDADLLALLADPPAPETRIAVARRPGLSERLGDALVATADAAAITALLDNETAAIREATLDALIAASAANTNWQSALVRRPHLSPRATRALASLVADHLLGVLAARTDLDPALALLLRARIDSRLQQGPAATAEPVETGEAAFLAALARGDRETATELLAAASRQRPAVVQRAMRLRSAKALVSLCWAADFSPAAAEPAQAVMARLSPEAMLPKPDLGGWPLSVDEMRWQIDMLNAAA